MLQKKKKKKKGRIFPFTDTDDSLQNEYVVNANCDLVCGRLQLINNEPERVVVGVFLLGRP